MEISELWIQKAVPDQMEWCFLTGVRLTEFQRSLPTNVSLILPESMIFLKNLSKEGKIKQKMDYCFIRSNVSGTYYKFSLYSSDTEKELI